jgi:hypothetical protein
MEEDVSEFLEEFNTNTYEVLRIQTKMGFEFSLETGKRNKVKCEIMVIVICNGKSLRF